MNENEFIEMQLQCLRQRMFEVLEEQKRTSSIVVFCELIITEDQQRIIANASGLTYENMKGELHHFFKGKHHGNICLSKQIGPLTMWEENADFQDAFDVGVQTIAEMQKRQ